MICWHFYCHCYVVPRDLLPSATREPAVACDVVPPRVVCNDSDRWSVKRTGNRNPRRDGTEPIGPAKAVHSAMEDRRLENCYER